MRVRRIGPAVAALVAAAACSSGSGRAPYLTQPADSCPAVDALAGRRSAEPLPADFRPVSAVRCTFRPGMGRPGAPPSFGLAWVSARRSTGPFDRLVEALRLPPQPRDGQPVCTDDYVAPELLALTDASGNTLVPALPGTVCGRPLPEVGSALEALPWVEIAHQQ